MPLITFIVLAKSIKHKKFCIAGKRFSNGTIGEWIRPVNATDSNSDALTYNDIEYSNNQRPELFHITSFSYLKKTPHEIQCENYSIDTSFYWRKSGVFNKLNINQLLDNPQNLWYNNFSSYNGENDRFPIALVKRPMQSLYFVNVCNLKIRVKRECIDFGNDLKRFRGFFTYNGINYGLIITDPKIYSAYGQQKEDTYDFGDCYITFSTAPHTDEYCYKFITAIIK
ncbi:dual OB domain-containing protein [Brenneria rubrifaciens]|uniref:Dual OB-containing domain-containing protein n=1 Tax=Brenneria rubrifaciens TaxID=55213 RepID=A0A4P8QRF2_9GAMM|nr:hypothetical protein [Brenneria rubrifaciens]QCR08119.1 hypothetical protein EH207_06050 [Brenneria rubrifaciens]